MSRSMAAPGCCLRPWRAAVLVAALVLVCAASAAAESANFDIDAQPLPAALRAFIEQSHMQLLYQYESVQGAMGNSVHGNMQKREALELLLRDSGLEASFSSENLAAVRPVATRARGALGRNNAVEQSGRGRPAAPSGSHLSAALLELDEVTVTARRREESLAKIPIAIAALSGDELHAAGVGSVVQLQYWVPGLMVSRDSQGVNLSIRGVTTTDTTTKGEPGINFNTDGIPVNRSEEQALGFFDVQRVEVLSGPQGTLYGKSSTGGAINVITNAPTQNREAAAAVELGNYGTKRLDAMINIPLTDVLAVRAAVNGNYRDGFVTLLGARGNDKPNDENNVAARISALAQLTDVFKVRVTFTTGRLRGVGFGNSGVALNTDAGYAGEGSTLGYANRFAGHVRDYFEKANVQTDALFGPLHLTYLGSRSHYKTDNLTPSYAYQSDGQRLWLRETYDTIYQELRVTNRDEDKLQYVLGANYSHERIRENGHFWSVGPSSVASLGYDPNYFNIINLLNTTTHTSQSAYAHFSYEVAPQWRVAAGLREATDETARRGTLASGPFAGFGPNGPAPWRNPSGAVCAGADDCVGTPNNGEGASSKVTYNIGTDYRFTPAQMGYFTVASGYKAGGFNDYDPATRGAQEYGPENIIAYEAGYKLRMLSGLQFNSALYYYDYSRAQITQSLELNNDPTNRVVYTRLTPAVIYGLEGSLLYPVATNSVLNIAGSLSKAHYGRFAAGATFNVDFSGKPLDRVPSNVLSLGFAHDLMAGRGALLRVHVASRYSSSYYVTDLWAARQYRQKPFTRSDADVTYISPSGRYTTQLFVRNIENRVQITGGAQNYIPGVPYSASGSISEPRLWGVRQTLKF